MIPKLKVKCFLLIFLSIFVYSFFPKRINAQELSYSRYIVDTLSSPYFWGRGYTNNGLDRSAQFIAYEMDRIGVQPLNRSSYFQEFTYSVNTFPEVAMVVLDGDTLVAGRDFLISPESRSLKAYNIDLKKADSGNIYYNKTSRLIVTSVEKLVWRPSLVQESYTKIEILNSVAKDPKIISLQVDATFIPDFPTKNVCGWVRGSQHPDRFIVVTAHYDHLGGMGREVYFPGANDNASGVALMLNLAKYYAKHPLSYSIVFIAFSGEEIGLLGSEFFVKNPLIPLDQIKFLVNIDLAGNGSEGITIVNATEYPEAFNQLIEINDQSELLTSINSRGKAKNSDHYHFTEAGVPSFFIYTQGGSLAYHDIYDRAETLPMDEQEDLFELIDGFFKWISKGNH